MSKSRRRLWLIVVLVGLVTASFPYPGSNSVLATVKSVPAAAAPASHDAEARTSAYETAAGTYGSASGTHRSGY